MRPPAQAMHDSGQGPGLVLVHGTAADGTGFAPLVRLLCKRARVVTYHRRGTPGWPADPVPTTVAEHAADLADLIRAVGPPAFLHGASFGAAIVLELCREHAELVRGAVLFEPSLSADDGPAPVTAAFLAAFERVLRQGRPEEAAERFQRRVLGDAVWERLPAQARARACCPHIHADLHANAAYRVRYRSLHDVDVPVLLLRGGRTGDAFKAQLHALAAALPRAELKVLARAGHQVGGEAWHDLAAAIADFMAENNR